MNVERNKTNDWPLGAKVETMALVLEAKHGDMASAVAEFFALFHGQKGNFERQAAWSDVSIHVRKRQMARDAAVADLVRSDDRAEYPLH